MTTEQISVRINGEDRSVARGISVRALLESLELNPDLIVVEQNRNILKREEFTEVQVGEGDVIELVHFVGGG